MPESIKRIKVTMLKKLCFYFLLCERVMSSRYSRLQNGLNSSQMFATETNDLLGKFFVELKSTCLDRTPRLRHVTIVGASTSYMRQIQPVFENIPKIWCSSSRECGLDVQFRQGNLVIVFVDDSSVMKTNVQILSHCQKCSFIFVCDDNLTIDDISLVLNLGYKQNVFKLSFAKVENSVIRLYSYFLTPNCSVEVKLLMEWRPGMSTQKLCGNSVFRLRNLNGCPVAITTLIFPPKMFIEESENGSLTIVGGREGKLVLTLAKELNFTIDLRYPSVASQLKVSRKIAIFNDVAFGNSDIGIGRLRPTDRQNDLVSLSLSYDEEFITWGVPRILHWSNDIVWVEFSWKVWIFIALVFSVTCTVVYASRNSLLKNAPGVELGFIAVLLDVLAIHLGNPAAHVCSSPGGRIMLMSIVLYAMVVTTAYKSSLSSILATDRGTPTIVDVQGIVDANLDVGGSLFEYDILQDQVNESKLSSILSERFVVTNNVTVANQLPSSLNYAFLGRLSVMDYERRVAIKNHEPVPFYVLDTCVLAYQPVMVFRKESLLQKPIDILIRAFAEAGLLESWDSAESDDDEVLERTSGEGSYSETNASNKFKSMLLFYFGCLLLSLFTFFVELLVHRLLRR